jgi:hypothetical protein
MCRAKFGTSGLRASLKELLQAGCPVDLSVAPEQAGSVTRKKLEIEQVGGALEAAIFQLENGHTGLRAALAITNLTSRAIDLRDVKVEALWDGCGWDWLTSQPVPCRDRRYRKSSYPAYVFPGNGLQLPPGDVLNRVLFEQCRLPAQRRLQGWVLGIGGPFPRDLQSGGLLRLSFVLVAADHTEYAAKIQFCAERREARTAGVKVQKIHAGGSPQSGRNNHGPIPANISGASLTPGPEPRDRRCALFD